MPANVASLVEAERAFAKMSVTVSMRDAFLANLAEDGIVFRPGPINGKELWRDRPASAAVLSWEPGYAEVAASGDFGFTTGPWEFRPDKDSEPAGFGHFVSVWKKLADGQWKVVLDIGISHDRPDSAPALAFRLSPDPTGWDRHNPYYHHHTAIRHAALAMADLTFSRACARGVRAAYETLAAEDVRRYRAGSFPGVGRTSIAAAVGDGVVADDEEHLGVGVSASGDLGYTYGHRTGAEEVYYVRIWRVEGGAWKLVLDIESPVPPEQN